MSWKKLGRRKENGGMGFRDLECFNLALLAKQGWRIIQNPNSLVARVFKEKYFRNDSFLTSNLGRRPSYAWRSVWSAKNLLKEGLIWRVGDGKDIKIWQDRWVPSPQTYSIQSPISMLDADARVSSIIDGDTNWWNTSLIHDIFRKEEADLICGMAICPRQQSDRQVWVGTMNGEFSVKSAYHLAKSSAEGVNGSCSNT
jgi:hypothetical protein